MPKKSEATERLVPIIKQLVEQERLTFQKVSDQLGISRSAVAGIVHRNKIKATRKPTGGKVAGRKYPKTKASPVAAVHAYAPDRIIRMTTSPVPPKDQLWQPLPGVTPISLLDAKRDEGCRWTVGKHQFCGQPGYPFCAAHADLAYQHQDERKARAA